MGTLKEYFDRAVDLREKRVFGFDFDKLVKEFQDYLKKYKSSDGAEVKEFLLQCIEYKDRYVMKLAVAVVDKRKLIKWKENENLFAECIDCILKNAGYTDEDDEDYIDSSELCYSLFVEKFVPLIKANQFLNTFTPKLFDMLVFALSSSHNRLQYAVTEYTEILPYSASTEKTLELFDAIHKFIKENPEISEDHSWSRCMDVTIIHIYRSCANNLKQAKKFAPHVTKIFIFCKDQDFVDPDNSDKTTVSQVFLRETLEDYLCRHKDCVEIVKPMFAAAKELWECDDEILKRDADNLMTLMSGDILAELDSESANVLIDRYLSGEDPTAINNFYQMYQTDPSLFDGYLDAIAEASDGAESWVATTTVSFFLQVAKDSPEKVSPTALKYLVNTLEIDATAGVGLSALVPVAEKYPELFLPHEDAIIASIARFKQMSSQSALILAHMARESEELTKKYLKILCDFSKQCDSNINMGLLYSIRILGAPFPQQLAKYKDLFEEYKKDGVLSQYADVLLDIIHGRSLAAVAQDVQEAQDDIQDIDERVTTTEKDVKKIGDDVTDTKVAVAAVANEVNEQGERLNELEDVVEETVEKVEEIDKKTLSHAPTWAKDVARLMNEKSEHDWRLLSSKLGYSNDDIRNWATQADPCLSMFDEWFATHKTREATHAILQNLEEMNRMDAAMIVENALKQTEDVVEDEEEDYIDPPEVFISYQWGVQEEVKLLKKHLEMAGFESWMDIGQMGGGDKLFAKIDSGIRAAKLIICCVTEKYAKSPNCNREVNLSVNLGKPIIPLLMEKMSWPPAGSMGPIFGEYLFIRFFARPGESAGDIRYWPIAKFQELLMQLRYSVVPKEDLIMDPYKNWQLPPEEVIVIKPKDNSSKTSGATSNSVAKEDEEMPDVFISYQWGKQPQIKALYRKLTSKGYSCWLDIMQMGGGDSLYDKIDKGVRNCKVVVSCVTEKYSYSANCRREVSLADALKKPIVPLLLEKITWPPAGPMSMVFTQLLYIDFCKPDIKIQDSWDCPQIGELEGKLNTHVPQINANDADDVQKNGEAKNHEEKNKAAVNQENTTKLESGNGKENNQSKPAESKPAESKPAESKPAESKPAAKNEKSSSCEIL